MSAAATAIGAEKAMVGQPAPDFNMGSTKNIKALNENVKLADYKGKWVVLLFYPLDFTFVCPTELTAFSDRYEDFQGINAEIIGVSLALAPKVRAKGAAMVECPVGGSTAPAALGTGQPG